MIRTIIVRLIQAVIAVVAIASIWWAGTSLYQMTDFGGPASSGGPPKTVDFTVTQGETTAQIADRLKEAGLIKQPLLFRIMLRFKAPDAKFEAGEFQLSTDMTTDELIDALSHAKQAASITVTIPEGWRAEEIAAKLASDGLVNADEFMNEVKNGQFDYGFLADRPAGTGVEGYLFPDTYFIPKSYTAHDIIKMMLDDFDKRFTPEMRQEVAKQGLNMHQIVTMASLVEREVRVPEERALVAGVFHNRLKAEMPLETDPTIQYAVGTSTDWWPKDLTVDDLAVDSPYNTYTHTGLPPGPICNPGLAALQAATAPAETDYMYFVATGDGSHVFARTLEEHNANVQKYRQP
ncbi:MAG: endolytic transglycosylase MltG [Chloroflexi bacterium]|nr:endolytic transglycosylase MltG [Chloroflexota bacterium]